MKEAHLFKITVFAVKDYIFQFYNNTECLKSSTVTGVLMHLYRIPSHHGIVHAYVANTKSNYS